MQNVSIHKAGELRPDIKSAVEQLLGRSIGVDEEVSIVAVPPQHAAPCVDRAAIARKLESFLNRRAERVRDSSEGEIGSAIDEAADCVRHRRG